MPTLPPPHQPIADRLHYPFSCQRPYGTALNVRFSPKRTFVPGRLNVRFAPEADIPCASRLVTGPPFDRFLDQLPGTRPITGTAQDVAGQGIGRLTIRHHRFAVDQHPIDTLGILGRMFGGRHVLDGGLVEHHHVCL